MFTVCPKCALTLVVTPTDLRVAQGYVRCGRCSNVFNAIIGLSEERKDGGSTQPSTATTSIIRKAPSIASDPPLESLSDTGETEAIYAEPEVSPEEARFQEAFIERPKPPAPEPSKPAEPAAIARSASAPDYTAAPTARNAPTPARNTSTAAPSPPVPPLPAATARNKALSPAGTGTTPPASVPPPLEDEDFIPDSALEFNPTATDVTTIFVDSPPAKKIDMRTGLTGKFQALKPDAPAPGSPPAQPNPAPQSSPARKTPPASAQRAATSTAVPAPAPPAPAAPPPSSAPVRPTTARTEGPRYPEDLVLEYDVRPVTVRFEAATPPPARLDTPTRQPPGKSTPKEKSGSGRTDSTGRQPALKVDPAQKPVAPQFGAFEDVTVTRSSGSPYDTADDFAAVARIAAEASGIRAGPSARNLDYSDQFTVGEDQVITEAPDDVGASNAAAAFTPQAAPRGRTAAWLGGIVALGVVLVAQAIHHNRHDLATNPSLNRPLTRFYAAIGVPLVPRWDLASYDVRQLGAFSGGGGNLTVRASLKNTAAQPLPLPLLRITVQDRYGNRIATRDVEPGGYVPGTVPEGAQLGVGQRIDAEMTFKDPGRDAVGFEIDACLPSPEARISCSSDIVAAR